MVVIVAPDTAQKGRVLSGKIRVCKLLKIKGRIAQKGALISAGGYKHLFW